MIASPALAHNAGPALAAHLNANAPSVEHRRILAQAQINASNAPLRNDTKPRAGYVGVCGCFGRSFGVWGSVCPTCGRAS